MSDQHTYLIEDGATFTLSKPVTTSIVFQVDGGEWAIRITKDGIESNPNVSIDDGARAIFEALKPYLQSLK